jgi:hypothetical protein
VQREGAAHVRDRLTLRLLRSQHTAATADYLMVFYRHSLSKRSQKRRCILDFTAYLEGVPL